MMGVEQLRKSTVAGVVLHLDRFRVSAFFATSATLGILLLAGCGNTYRPVVSSINPVGPAAQPQKYAVAISSPSDTSQGLVTLIDFAGDTILNTTLIGVHPQYLALSPNGGTAFTLNADGTANSFNVSPSLLSTNIAQITLPANSRPVSIYSQQNNLYIAESGRNSVAQFSSTGSAFGQELPTGAGTIYTVGSASAPRAYAIANGNGTGNGIVSAIETTSNTVSGMIPVGVNPVYGVMTPDSTRAFILNKGSNDVTVINAQNNALDRFTTASGVSSTIPVGIAPVWADLAPTLAELVVANAGNGSSAGSLTVINIPHCPVTAVASNPNCDPADPLNALGFGQVLANIPVGVNPVMVAVLQDGTRAYVANAGNAALGIAGSVSVVNLTTNTVVATLQAGASLNAQDQIVHGHPAFIAATTGTPTGKVYVTSLDSTDITIIRTDTDTIQTHLPLQGNGVAVRVNQP